MNAFERIIGCSREKRELANLCNALKNPEGCERLGAKVPSGLLLYGPRGTGKTLMANALMEELGRKTVTLGGEAPREDFAAALEAAAGEAVRCAPSILFIDDLELYVHDSGCCAIPDRADELQECIDGLKGKNVFLLAVLNHRERFTPEFLIRNLPLLNLDLQNLEVKGTAGQDTVEVFSRILRERGLDSLDPEAVAKALDRHSSIGSLEEILAEAGFLAACDRSPRISMEHFLRACLRLLYHIADDAGPASGAPAARLECIACHEAGHAVVREVLSPGSVSILYAGNGRGLTDYCRDGSQTALHRAKSRIAGSLGGTAAEELKYGRFDANSKGDIEKAFRAARSLVQGGCIRGFDLHSMGEDPSGQLLSAQEAAVAAEVEEGYRKAREILTANGEFFKKLVAALVEKRVLSSLDVARIRSGCTITPACA